MRSQGLVMGNHFHFPPSFFWATPMTFLTTDASMLQMVLWLTWLKCSAIHHFGSLGVDGTLLPDWDPTTTFSDVHFLRVGTNDYVNDFGSAAVESCEVQNSVCVVDVGCSSGKCTPGSLAWEGSDLLLLLVWGEGAMDQNVSKVSILPINAHGHGLEDILCSRIVGPDAISSWLPGSLYDRWESYKLTDFSSDVWFPECCRAFWWLMFAAFLWLAATTSLG